MTRVVEIAYSSTLASAQFRLSRLRHNDEEVFNYVIAIDPSLWIEAYYRTGRHWQRFSNGIESYWSQIDPGRYLTNVVEFFMFVYSNSIDHLRAVAFRASLWNPAMTSYAERIVSSQVAKAASGCTSRPLSSPWQADVTDRFGRTFAVDFLLRKCTCKFRTLHAFPCEHLLHVASSLSVPTNQPHLLVAPCYWKESWRAVLQSGVDAMTPFPFAKDALHPENAFENYLYPAPKETRKRNHASQRSRSTTGGQAPTTILYENVADYLESLSSSPQPSDSPSSSSTSSQMPISLVTRSAVSSSSSSSTSSESSLLPHCLPVGSFLSLIPPRSPSARGASLQSQYIEGYLSEESSPSGPIMASSAAPRGRVLFSDGRKTRRIPSQGELAKKRRT